MIRRKSTTEILKKRTRHNDKHIGSLLFRVAFWMMIFIIITGSLGLFGTYYFLSQDLPKIATLKDYHPPIITTVYSDDNRKIAEFFRERRIVMPLSELPDMLLEAFVAAEDARFYKHQGIDLFSIVRAFFKNIEAGTIVQGGSTITQQVTKSFFLTPANSKKPFWRIASTRLSTKTKFCFCI